MVAAPAGTRPPAPAAAASGALTDADRAFVASAARYLESAGYWVRVADLVGRPVDQALATIPASVRGAITSAVSRALDQGLAWVTDDVVRPPRAIEDLAGAARAARTRARRHTAVTAATGAVGGLFGASTLALELPVTTLVMLRSIAQVAADMGADLTAPATRLECLSVLSLGGSRRGLDAGDSAYLAARLAVSRAVHEAARRATAPGMRGLIANPAIARLVATIAARFEVAVTERTLARALPLVGAVGGAVVNTAFTHHYNSLALYHFGLRQIEARAGMERVAALYRAEAARERGLGERAAAG